MNEYAEEHNFIVLYPLQTALANANKCWNWFLPAHQRRGLGEPKLVADTVVAVAGRYTIDTDAVFCAGLSAGAAMTVIMGVTYPDVFRGIGVAAGLEFEAAKSTLAAFTAMISGGPAPLTQGTAAWRLMQPYYEGPTEVLVVHGTSDFTVYPVNGKQVAEQWIHTNNLGLGSSRISLTPTTVIDGQVPGGRVFVENQYTDSETGVILVRHVVVTSMAHAWSGGSSTGTYTDPSGPDMSMLMIKWFLQRSTIINNGTIVN